MKKRCFYLDFIRAVAVICILLTHYNANYIYMNDPSALKKAVITTKVANIYIGDFGVALFLIISGAALMYTYGESLDLKSFYKKRFQSIYPMFWIAYVIAFSYSFLANKGFIWSLPKGRILLSVLGMDGYLGTVIPTFYLLGEWFLGFIIIIYILFPLLRKGVHDYPKVTIAIVLGLYVYFMLDYKIPFIKNIFLFIRLPEIIFGMCFVKYIKKVNGMTAAVAAVILALNGIIKPDFDSSFQMTYVGICAFLVLAYIGHFLENSIIITRICHILSKYSYAVFLTHHYIINVVVSKIDLSTLTVLESYVLFFIICCIIAFCSKLLYCIHDYVVKNFEKYYGMVKQNIEKKENG